MAIKSFAKVIKKRSLATGRSKAFVKIENEQNLFDGYNQIICYIPNT